jgi:hypothetical protein
MATDLPSQSDELGPQMGPAESQCIGFRLVDENRGLIVLYAPCWH